MLKKVMVVLFIGFVLIQFYPVSRTNPPVISELPGDSAAKDLFKRACYDCHSHETVWPWYSYVAPVSWLVTDDVSHAREHLNFSSWGEYNVKQQKHKLEEIIEEVEEGNMPLWFYLPLHAHAKIQEEDVATLRAWAKGLSVVDSTSNAVQSESSHGEPGHQH